MYKNKSLLDLPVLPDDIDGAGETDIIGSTYLNELNHINNTDDLVSFINRWTNLWLLKSRRKSAVADLSIEVEKLVNIDFDTKIVFDLLQRREDDEVAKAYPNDENVRIMCHIALPEAALEVLWVSTHYGVAHDLGFVRLYFDATNGEDRKDFAKARALIETQQRLRDEKMERILKQGMFIWPIADIEAKIIDTANELNVKECTSLVCTLHLIHDLAIKCGLIYLPKPTIDYNPELGEFESGLEMTWFYKEKKRILSFEHLDSSLKMHWMVHDTDCWSGYGEINPSNERITDALKWVAGAVRNLELTKEQKLRNILS